MAHTLRNKLRGLAAAFVAVMAALAIVPGAAFAEPGDAWTGIGSSTGTITITNSDSDHPIDPDGVHVYQIAQVTYDPTNNTTDLETLGNLDDNVVSNWYTNHDAASANAIANAVNANNSGISEMEASVTKSGTGVVIADLPMGVYYIQIDPNAATGKVYQNIVVGLSPEPNSAHTGFVAGSAEVEVKQSDSKLEKTIVDVKDSEGLKASGAGTDGIYEVGDTVDFNVDFTVGAAMTEYHMTDTMGAGLSYADGSLHVYAGPGDTNELAPGDYTLTGPAVAQNGVTTFTVALTASGIQKCAADGAAPHMVYSATITKAATVDGGNATNSVTSTMNTDGSQANLDFAGIKVYKYSTEEGSTPLQGAVFGLYTDPACNDKITDATTDSDGNLTFDVLLDPAQTYYVKEISAPSGYQSIDTVFTFLPSTTESVPEGQTKLAVNNYVSISVPNTPSGYPGGIGLPTTGGTGTVLFTAAGVVIIAGAAAFIARSRKQQND